MREFTDIEYVKAIVKAFDIGNKDNFIVINEDHFERLIDDGQLAFCGNTLVKVSSGKAVWFAFAEGTV